VTTPPQPPRRPGGRGEPVRRQDPPTQRLPRQGRPDAPTERFQARPRSGDAAPTERLPRRPEPPGPALPDRPTGQPDRRRWLRQPTTIALIALIVVALLTGGLAGAELYARHRADILLVAVAECVVKDGATVSFGVNPPFLWQHVTGHYTNISVSTEGNQVQDAKGMTADVTVADVRLQGTADSKGTIGSLTATLTWTANGIKDTVAANLPGVGNLVTGVTTNATAGTIDIEAGSIAVTARPAVVDGDLALQVVSVSGPLPQDTVQTALDGLTSKLNAQYPLGIHADAVKVTDTGVVGTFSTTNASIPRDDADACFSRL
jgi:hypothetical protein